jgi:hypothetical protein
LASWVRVLLVSLQLSLLPRVTRLLLLLLLLVTSS